MDMKKRILKCYIFSILTYGCETWTVNKSNIKKITAFEQWCNRRMLKISWTQKLSNNEVLNKCGVKSHNWFKEIIRRKMAFAGHVFRGSSGNVMLNIIEGKINGKRSKGRPRKTWLDNITEWTAIKNYGIIKRTAENRQLWRNLTVNPLTEDGT